MDNNALKDFKKLIREGNYDNTYKMAWAKAIVVICLYLNKKYDELDYKVEIQLFDISKEMIKFYWNQTIFFNLIQGSNIQKRPALVTLVKEMIEDYYKMIGTRKPTFFENASVVINQKDKDYLNRKYKKGALILKQNVAFRFLRVNNQNIKTVYEYEMGWNSLFMQKELVKALAEEYEDLFDIINYRWSLILENFNMSPRVNKKVRIIDDVDVKRSSLARFDKYLDLENSEHKCFICGKKINVNELARDHVIPWSYLYDDNLRNIVYVCQSCNSIKSNIIPSPETILKLKSRNKKLLYILEKEDISGKDVDELKLAIENDLVDQFYLRCKY